MHSEYDTQTLKRFLCGRLTGDAAERLSLAVDRDDSLAKRLDELTAANAPGIDFPESDIVVSNAARGLAPDVLQSIIELRCPKARAGDGRPPVDFSVLPAIGPFQIMRFVGAGGCGIVFEAQHIILGTCVALKVLSDEQFSSAGRRRFLNEMKTSATLKHPHVVRAIDAGVHAGIPYLAMEYVDGVDAGRLVTERGPLPVGIACEITRQASLAMQFIHESGLLHRDVKPSNLLIDRTGTVKLADLGLARLMEVNPNARLTRSDHLIGTIDYLAPEAADCNDRVEVRSDLYSLGCTLYHLLCGVPPFWERDREPVLSKLDAHRNQLPLPLAAACIDPVPPELTGIVDRLLAKRPEHRFATAREFVEAITPLCEGDAIAEFAASEIDRVGNSEGEPLPRPALRFINRVRSFERGELTSNRSTAARLWHPQTVVALVVLTFGVALGAYWLGTLHHHRTPSSTLSGITTSRQTGATTPSIFQLTKKWTPLFLIRETSKQVRIIPEDFHVDHPEPFALEGPFPDEPNLLGSFDCTGRFVVQNGALRRVGDDDALLRLPAADEFELEGNVELKQLGGWLILVGWDEDTRSGYAVYHVQLKTSGAPWHVCEFKNGRAVTDFDREILRQEVAGEGPIDVRVADKKLSLTLAGTPVLKDLPLSDYRGGRVMIGTYRSRYGPKDISFFSLRMRAL